jgi:hypothetical protein
MNKLLIALLLFFLGQSLIWIQTNGQFVWPWFKRHPFLISITMGTLISYLLIFGTKLIVEYYDGLLWPGRFIAFGSGMISFTFLTWYLLGEGITLKTIVSLFVACSLIGIQLLWKS